MLRLSRYFHGSNCFAVPTSNTAVFTQTMQVDAGLTAQLARVCLNYYLKAP